MNEDPAFPGLSLAFIEEGLGKYVQVRVSNGEKSVIVVRQDLSGEYHIDVARPIANLCRLKNWSAEVLGGGRISYDAEKNHIFIYGYSMQYGQPDHGITAELYRAAFPHCTVTWSNDGY